MAVTKEEMVRWCQALVEPSADAAERSLEAYLDAIPRLDSLSDCSEGTRVLIRGDVDAKPGANVGDGDVRLRSMEDTLEYGRQRGWVQVIFGHIGRKPEGSLDKVAARLGELLGADVPLLSDWLDEESMTISDAAAGAIADAAPGSILMLDNTRRYDVERLLWKANADEAAAAADKLARLANSFAEKVATVYVNEALSAGSLDASSTVVPAAMDRVALGHYVAGEFDGPMRRCREADLVVFSGLKADKLDDLEAIVNRGHVKLVLSAGSLAMALAKAAAELDGQEFSMGVAEDPAHADKPYFIPRERIDQARRMVEAGREQGIEFVTPVDFVLQDGQASDLIGPGDQQFDVGPKSSALYAEKVSEFIAASKSRGDGKTSVAFHNGVFGMFEDERFAEGTRKFVGELKRMKDAGVEVYVGGGEGGKALDLYGEPDWVTHCFTAGGTVLNALGGEPVPYLLALSMATAK
ncbi:MAG: phosphoglycerate kinase [Planctomycetales bacterium]|nr:phosphoglycerate kinase [Planctomycetales bacterium]